jgi:hypothetical protein
VCAGQAPERILRCTIAPAPVLAQASVDPACVIIALLTAMRLVLECCFSSFEILHGIVFRSLNYRLPSYHRSTHDLAEFDSSRWLLATLLGHVGTHRCLLAAVLFDAYADSELLACRLCQ